MGVGSWTDEQTQFLRDLVGGGASFAVAATEINARFNTSYTRNSTIGRAHRIGLCAVRLRVVKKERPKIENRKTIRIVRANGNSNQRRIVELVETDLEEMRCVEVVPRHVALLDLERHHCRFPYGESAFTFCGHTVVEGFSYCQPHRMLCTRDDRRGNRTAETAQRFSLLLRKRNISKTVVLSSGDWADEAIA